MKNHLLLVISSIACICTLAFANEPSSEEHIYNPATYATNPNITGIIKVHVMKNGGNNTVNENTVATIFVTQSESMEALQTLTLNAALQLNYISEEDLAYSKLNLKLFSKKWKLHTHFGLPLKSIQELQDGQYLFLVPAGHVFFWPGKIFLICSLLLTICSILCWKTSSIARS